MVPITIWNTVFRSKRTGFCSSGWSSIAKVAGFGEVEVACLLKDAGIIRNRLKVAAAIHNAGVILDLQATHGSFLNWLEAHYPLEKADWVKLFKRTFRFTGGEITGEFLMSTGFLPGAHDPGCPVYARTIAAGAAWARDSI
jgi:DNA-3-methyladenine glycosylase I